MGRSIANFFSIIFHPLIIPTIGAIILLNLNTLITYTLPGQSKNLILLIVFINTAIAPLLAVFFMKKIGIITDMELYKREERFLPMVASVIFYFFTFYIFKQANLPSFIQLYFLGATLLLIISLFITLKWKISLHMVCMGGFTGLLIVTSLLLQINISLLIILTILASGILGSSRLKLNMHNLSQVSAGYILGVSLMILLFFVFRGP